MKKEKIILFDLDGTLIDSTDAIISTFRHAFKEQKFEFSGDDKEIKDLIGYPLDIMFQSLGVDESRVWDFVGSYKNRYRIISKEQTTLLENAYEALELASQFARVSVVTTKPVKVTPVFLGPELVHELKDGRIDDFLVAEGHLDWPKVILLVS